MEPRPVTVAAQQGNNWVITSGLNAGDKVVVAGTTIAGMMAAQTGVKTVTTKEWTPPAEAANTPAESQSAAASAPQTSASEPKTDVQTASEVKPEAKSASEAKSK